MFWDGSRWVEETRTPAPTPIATHRARTRDWLATGIMALAVVGLVLPMVGASAAPPPAKPLIKDWEQAWETTTIQENSKRLTYTGRWARADHDAYLGDHVRFSDARGSKVSLSFTGTGITWVGPVGPTRGRADVYLDGRKIKTVNTYAARFRPTRVLFRLTFDAMEKHRLSIKVVGTAGHPTVAIDALVVRGKPIGKPGKGGAKQTPTPSAAPSVEPTSQPTETPTPTVEAQIPAPTATATATGTAAPSDAPSATPVPSASAAPVVTAAPPATPAPTATASPTPAPTAAPPPTPAPTAAPTATPPPTPAPTAAPTATPPPTPAPTATPPPTPAPTAASSACTTTLQARIDAAPAGSTLQLPNCVYRGSATVSKPLTILGPATIKGSDVWTSWSGNVSTASVPSLPTNGSCAEARCAWPEQVFIDGVPQRQVASSASPGPGQFKLDGSRRIVLGTSPSGRVVEVTVRRSWLRITGDDVTISGMTMRHAANGPQSGGLQVAAGADRVKILNAVLSDAHGGVVSFQGTTGSQLRGSDVTRGGQLGVHIGGSYTNGVTIASNRIHGNSTEGFDSQWEAGGLKAAVSTDLDLVDNLVYDNAGPGLWCDIDCSDVLYARNRVHHNSGAGIFFEISDGAIIEDNVVWENGWDHRAWGWGAGILVSSSSNAVVRRNVVAWNPDGISIVSQNRGHAVGGNDVHDNDVVMSGVASDTSDKFMLGWIQDWSGPLYSSGNRGSGNRYWNAKAEPSTRFGWTSNHSTLSTFNATPGEESGRYLSTGERDALLSAKGVPLSQASH